MATNTLRKNGSWQVRFVKKGVLQSPVYFTFDSKAEGDAYIASVEPLLERGIVPPEMRGGPMATLGDLLDMYSGLTTLPESERLALVTVTKLLQTTPVTRLSYAWLEAWINGFKAAGRSPSTFKKYVGVLSRAVEWGMRTEKLVLASNPCKLLPRGYGKTSSDRNLQWEGERDRRLENKEVTIKNEDGSLTVYPTEEEAIRKTLIKKEERLMFDMALETAMRLRESYTITVGQIDLGKRTIFLDKTKNGSKRQVPISSVLLKLLSEEVKGKPAEAMLFPYWVNPHPNKRVLSEGEQSDVRLSLRKATSKLSQMFSNRFAKAGCPDLHWHDLRHEATSRFYERTTMSDLEISKITGHKDMSMLARYANLRGSSLVSKMW